MAKFDQAMMDLYRYNGALLPRQRSIFTKRHSHTTTFDSARLVPVMWDRVLPGDEKKISFSALARMATPLHPVMDEAMLYAWCFYVPDRLWWDHAKEFYGENLDASFNPDGEYVMPFIKPSQYMVYNRHIDTDGTGEYSDSYKYGDIGSLNDYFGYPVFQGLTENMDWSKIDDHLSTYCSAGLHRCYQLIWNEHFRNSSIQPALRLNKGDTVTDAEWEVIREIRNVNKLPDQFTMLLREPQAGDDVLLPLGDRAPVVSAVDNIDMEKYYDDAGPAASMWSADALRFANYHGGDGNYNATTGQYLFLGDNYTLGVSYDSASKDSMFGAGLHPMNLWADLTSSTAATINNLRAAITVQQLLETDAAAGKYYHTVLSAHFGVFTPDAILQRSELLGACRASVNMRQVLQTSSGTDLSPQGNAAAVSITGISNELICDRAFTEPGFLLVLVSCRNVNSYSQGINPLLKKLQRYDHYWPVFDHIGYQPVYSSEVMASFRPANVDIEYLESVFGYRPAWDEYRTMNNRVSGLMRPDVDGTLASWNYTTNFDTFEKPILNSAFIEASPDPIDRTIAINTQPQFILDCYFDYTDVKNMSVRSVPGLTRL